MLDRLQTSEQGLTDEEAARRLEQFGPNQLPETYRNPFLIFLRCVARLPQLETRARGPDSRARARERHATSFLWNPLSWAMEAAAIISIALVDYVDFIVRGGRERPRTTCARARAR